MDELLNDTYDYNKLKELYYGDIKSLFEPIKYGPLNKNITYETIKKQYQLNISSN
jgi:hypothetical protein